jgi:hypothetical protein
VIGRLIGEVRELIGRVFRTGECLRAAGRLLAQAFLYRSRRKARASASASAGQVTGVRVGRQVTGGHDEPRKTLGWKTPAEALNEHLLSTQEPGVATTG